MKSKLFLVICLLGCILQGLHVKGQNNEKIDSLKILVKAAKSESERAIAYQNISFHLIRENKKMDVAKLYADSIMLLANGDKKFLNSAEFLYAWINHYDGKYDSALRQFNSYLDYYREKGDSLEVVKALYGIGTVYNQQGKYEENMVIQNRILAIHTDKNDKMEMANSLNSIGNIHSNFGNNTEAIMMYEQAAKIYDSLNIELRYAMQLNNIANIYVYDGEFEKGISYYEKALESTRKSNSDYHTAFLLNNLGFTYTELKMNKKALSYVLESLKIRRGLKQKSGLVSSLNNTGYVYYKLKEYDKAQSYLEEALEIANELQSPSSLLDVYEYTSLIYEGRKDFENAFFYKNLHVQLKDSIFNSEKSKQIAELQTKYETAEKDKEIAVLSKENELQEANAEKEATLRSALIGGLVALCIIAVLLFNTMRQKLKNQKLFAAKNEEINRAKLSEELQTLEMKALRAQMNPHFLFNSLNSINTMILNDEPESASRYLSKFSKLVRLMLENSEQPQVTLKDELETLEAYIQLEAIRFKNKMDYKIETDSSIDQDEILIPSMVLQPFVENAIWHGLLHKNKKGLLTINIKEEGDNLLCSIIDNGVGREKSLTLKKDGGLKKKSMGIKITADRLKLLTKQKIKDVINIIDLKDNENNALGTQVNIQIPLS